MSRSADAGLSAILEFVCERTGLRIVEQRRFALASVQQAMHDAGAADPDAYLRLLKRGGPALDKLLTELTVGETYFFREPLQWEFVRERVVPELLSRRARRHPISAWSAACASGEEPYTLAILLREMGLPQSYILGTDLSRDRLEVARRGSFSAWSLRATDAALQGRYFSRSRDRYRLASEIRSAVEFRQHNLAEAVVPAPPHGGGFDLVFCRNALIYLERDTVALVAQRLIDSLSPAGWLFLGATDPPIGELVACEVVTTGAGLAYRRRRAGAPRALVSASQPALPAPRSEPTRPARPRSVSAGRPAGGAPPTPRRRTAPAVAEASLDEMKRLYASRDYALVAERGATLTSRSPGEPEAWVLRVRALANLGRVAEAGEACAAALDLHPTVPELIYLQAVLQVQSGSVGAAAELLRRALYLDPDLAVGHLLRGILAAQRGDAAVATRALRVAERLLEPLAPDEVPRASDGESAAGLLQTTRAQLQRLSTRKTG